ncbi:MAG: hypothetical protein R6U63_12285 [Longimicrobiales bacterium]
MDPKLLVRSAALVGLVLGVCLGCGDDGSTVSAPPPDYMHASFTGAVERVFDGDVTFFYRPDLEEALEIESHEVGPGSRVWIHNLGSDEIEPGSHDLQPVSVWPWPDPSFDGVTMTVQEGGFMYRATEGRLQIDSVDDVRIKGSFDMTAARFCASNDVCTFDPDSIDAGTPRLQAVGVFQAVKRPEGGGAVIYGEGGN